MRRRTGLGVLVIASLALAGCTAGPEGPTASSTPAGSSPSAVTTSAVAPTPSATPSATATPSAKPSPTSAKPSAKPNPISVQALIEKSYDGRDLRLGRQIGSTSAYKRYLVSYRGDGLRLTGVMNVPTGKGPFPVLVLNHGYIDPDIYVAGQGFAREQDFLARRGFVVLHIDYRNHAGSDNDPNADYELRLGYAVDAVNAVKAVKASKLRFLDKDRVGMMGRSMGGNVTMNALVAQPDLVDAAVLYATTSSLAAENWRQFSREGDDQRTNRRIARTYGLPEDNPDFWLAASPRPYLGRVSAPVLLHHGTADDTCPPRWARSATRALQTAGKDVTLRWYEGQGHRMEGAAFARSIDRTADFFAANLK
jgi:dipeptidyl aminopeptidase/acylaminoacyl peptidase